jgi:hypothetical protein
MIRVVASRAFVVLDDVSLFVLIVVLDSINAVSTI